jgi:hypothetical protein
MKTKSSLKTLSLVGAVWAAGWPGLVQGQDAGELDKLKSTVKSMEQTIQEMNRKIADLEKQSEAAPLPPQPAPPPPVPGVPPSMHPGADLKPKVPPPADELADGTTQVPYQETMKEEDLGAPRPGNAPLDPSYQGFMQLFGTKTWIKLGGYAKLDAIADSTKVGNPNMFITSKIPVEGEADFDKGEHFAMHAKQTRLSLELRSPTALGSLKIYYENDFFGSPNDDPSMNYRLRHFYGQVANLTAGQTWSTFYDPDVNPDTLDFEGPGVLPVLRQPELRYTIPIKKNAMYAALAIEQPKSDLSNLPAGADGRNTMPDFTGHWRWEGKPGHVQIGGVLRSLSFDSNVGPDDHELGWGVNLSGGLKTFGADNLIASFSYGDGIGRYIQDLPSGSAGVVDAEGNLHTLSAWGAMIGYRHQWSEKWRSTVSYSFVQLDNRSEQGDFAYDQTHYAQGNLVWAPTKNFYVGLEYLYGFKEARNDNSGDNHRVQLSLQYKLVR